MIDLQAAHRWWRSARTAVIVGAIARERWLSRRDGRARIYDGSSDGFSLEIGCDRELARVVVTLPAPAAPYWEIEASRGFLSSAFAAAIIDRPLRRWLRGDLIVRGHHVSVSGAVKRGRELDQMIGSALEVARRVTTPPEDPIAALLSVVLVDPWPTARANAARELVRLAPADLRAVSAIDAALGDPDLEARFHVAVALGPDGFDAVEAIAALAGGEIERRAVIYAHDRLPPERAERIFRGVLTKDWASTAALEIALHSLAELVPSDLLGSVIAAIAERRVISTHLETTVIDLLSRRDPTEVETSLLALFEARSRGSTFAARLLGELGTSRSIPSLERRLGETTDADARAIGRAIDAIRGRARPTGQGCLSIAASADRSGAVSFATGGGELSRPGAGRR